MASMPAWSTTVSASDAPCASVGIDRFIRPPWPWERAVRIQLAENDALAVLKGERTLLWLGGGFIMTAARRG